MQYVLGVFSGVGAADEAVTALKDAGYTTDSMSAIVKEGVTQVRDVGSTKAETVTEGAVSGATTGGVIGGIAGLLVGIGALAIPGIGAVMVAGPLVAVLGLTGTAAATVSGAATGAMAGGLIGALVGLGVPEDTAKLYEETIQAGGVLLTVPADSSEHEREVRSILQGAGAKEVTSIVSLNK